jgi:hypothetical protein
MHHPGKALEGLAGMGDQRAMALLCDGQAPGVM